MQPTFSIRFSPLQGYTDAIYRQAHARFFGGVECYYSPFVRVEHGEIRRKDVRDIEPENNEGFRLVPQLIAPDLEKAERILELFVSRGYREADLNLGCPFPLLANPALGLEYARGSELSEAEKFESIRLMHSDVFCRYAELLQGGDRQLLMKMKSFWEYLLPEGDRKAHKAIHKASRLDAYQAAVSTLLRF